MPFRITKEKLEIFLRVYKRKGGNATEAIKELQPELSSASQSVTANRFLNYIDPYKVIFPRFGKKLTMADLEITERKSTKALKAETSQKVFEALFEKHGGNGMKAAMLAIGELYPHFKTQKTKLEKARWHLIKSPFVLDLISALESKGVDANALADKIKTLLFAKKKMTVTRNNNGETEWREEEDVAAIDKGLTHALKAGIGGGYAPEKSLVGVKDFSLGKLLDQLDKQKDK